jgi:hypothetical protein
LNRWEEEDVRKFSGGVAYLRDFIYVKDVGPAAHLVPQKQLRGKDLRWHRGSENVAT